MSKYKSYTYSILPRLTHTKCLVAVLTFMILLSVIPSSVANLSPPTESAIKVIADKPIYERGNIITVSGSIKSVSGNIPLTVRILAPDTGLVYIAQVLVSNDGTFTFPVKVEGPLWRIPGTYTISVQYGFKHISAQTTFEFVEKNIPVIGAFNVKDHTSGQSFYLNYTIIGGTVKDISIEPKDLSLIVTIDATTNGVINLHIPRLLIDAKTEGNQDDSFIVLIDDEEIQTPAEEPTDFNHRLLKIPFLKGDSRLEIIGTTIIPEFSGVTSIVLIIAFVASMVFIMLVSLKLDNRKLWIVSNV